MALVVFLRAVNVGGSNSFKPSQLPDELPGLEMTNLGAAGTYVVEANVGPDEVRTAILDALPFETEVLVRDGAWVLDLLDDDPLGSMGYGDDVKRSLSILARPPEEVPALPIDRPEEGPWQLRITTVEDGYALSVRRPEQDGRFYPNGTVEDVLGVPATTRGWRTVERVGRILEDAA